MGVLGKGQRGARLTGPREATAHACNGLRGPAVLLGSKEFGVGVKEEVPGFAQELKWNWARDVEEHMALRERWGEMRKFSLLDIVHNTL